MTDQVLDILKLVLLALLYLFFARVLWAVWSEVRQPADARQATDHARAPAPTPAAGTPAPGRREVRPAKGRGGTPARLLVIEPKERAGTVFALGDTVTIGRDPTNTIVITDDAYISSHHASVSHGDGGGVVIDDHGSRNGTYLNGTRLATRRPVHVGDRIQLGYTVLEAQ